MNTMWDEAGTKITSFVFTCVMFLQLFLDFLRRYIQGIKDKSVRYFFPYIHIPFHEFSGSSYKRSQAYTIIETYLGSKSTAHSRSIIGDLVEKHESVALSVDASGEIIDVFDGVEVKWFLKRIVPNSKSISRRPNDIEKKCYVLTFHNKDRELVTSRYLNHVMKEGRDIAIKKRQQRIHADNPNPSPSVFKHPSTFQRLKNILKAAKKTKMIKLLKTKKKEKKEEKKKDAKKTLGSSPNV